MDKQMTNSSNIKARTKKNTIRLAVWTTSWVLATAGVTFGSKFLWEYETIPTIIGVVFHLVLGFGMILANARHLKELDELQKKIQFDAMGFSLGTGLVVGLSYEQLQGLKLITFEPQISHLIILMALTYITGILLGNRRYR